MKIIAALLVLAVLSSAHAFLILPRSGKMSDLHDAYYGMVEGIGATHDGIAVNENCFGDATKENLADLLDQMASLQMTSHISDLFPVFESLASLVTGLYNNCEVPTLLNHILAHSSSISSIQNFAMNLIQESHHLQHLLLEIFRMNDNFDYSNAGRILGEAFGVILSLRGVEKVPHN